MNEPDHDAEIERARLRREAEETKAELERIQAEADKLLPPEEAATRAETQRRQMAEDDDVREMFESMTDEEKMEFSQAVKAHLEAHRDELKAMNLPGFDVDAVVAGLQRAENRAKKAAQLVNETEDAYYRHLGIMAEAQTRLFLSFARTMRKLEDLSDQQWEAIPQGKRGELLDFLSQWRNGLRETILSQLPIEMRRRFEQGEN